MLEAIQFSVAVRKKIIQLIDSLTIEKINKIPSGFNNNIGWNFGHIVVSSHSLAYIASGINPKIEVPFRDAFGKGSQPEKFISQDQINFFKTEAFDIIERIKSDFLSDIPFTIHPYVTQTFGLPNDSKESIMQCIAMHDSYHYGCVRMLLKNIK